MVSGTRVPADDVPLCVDLDGTLLRTDSLVEATLLLLKGAPSAVLLLPIWLLRGKAVLKDEVAKRVTLDPAALPYRDELLEFLRVERAKGRSLLLVSAAHESIVRAVARHLGLFDDVIATDAATNLKGAAKRAALVERFGTGGFDYAGDSPADVPVWEAARRAIVVSNDADLARRAGPRVDRIFTSPARRVSALARALRVPQWVKNFLVFVPLLMAPEARELPLFLDAALAFAAFSVCASAVYVANDLLDLAADRRHRTKSRRPFAAGDLPLAAGLALIPACLVAGFGIAWLFLPPAFLGVLTVYLAVTTAYSFRLKHVPLVDVIVLALLYTGRVIAGAAATHVWPSPWILGFSLFFFLSLAFVKRYAELYVLRGEPPELRVRGYYPTDLQLVAVNGAVSGYIAVLVAALYINSDRVVGVYARPELLWLICPLLLYWISRIWMLAFRGQLHDDPVLFAITDRESWIVGSLIAAVLLLARLL
ncbi:MAG: UbiA family prenyltransferase [Deltaproteobacteria bacterium]|nr:UbiA family prenyltransferase [Deltaproteobacteria bacterium]